jgi:HSP20 family protein
MAEQQSKSAGSRSIRLLDPFSIWYKPEILLPRLLQGSVPGMNSNVVRHGGRTGYGPAFSWMPAVEIEYADDNLTITAELPGLAMEDVKVEVIGNVLILQGERRPERAAGTTMRSERRYGYFYREIVLPDGADVEHIRAELENGILRITVPLVTDKRVVPIQNNSRQRDSAEGAASKEQAA